MSHKFQGKISVSHYTGSREGVTIRLDDESSGIMMFEADLTIEQFGSAIAGNGFIDCLFEIGNPLLVGTKREVKTEVIPLDKYPSDLTSMEIEGILQKYEERGWIGRREDFKNHHKYGRNSVSVDFIRFVNSAGNPVDREE